MSKFILLSDFNKKTEIGIAVDTITHLLPYSTGTKVMLKGGGHYPPHFFIAEDIQTVVNKLNALTDVTTYDEISQLLKRFNKKT